MLGKTEEGGEERGAGGGHKNGGRQSWWASGSERRRGRTYPRAERHAMTSETMQGGARGCLGKYHTVGKAYSPAKYGACISVFMR